MNTTHLHDDDSDECSMAPGRKLEREELTKTEIERKGWICCKNHHESTLTAPARSCKLRNVQHTERRLKNNKRLAGSTVLCELGSGPNSPGKFARLPFEAVLICANLRPNKIT